MKLQEKLSYLQDNHLGEWLKVRAETADEISDKQSMFCLCGKLATGLHESHCKKLADKITEETVKKLEYLFIPSSKKGIKPVNNMQSPGLC